ncbi:MAG: pantoate--beta-alanine ligase [Bergeyella sp.]|nr:pantoate--beta-alanine ligase [Bergeyella sp.]
MQILEDRNALSSYLLEQKKLHKTLGFAPTMGALHEGHISLYKLARKQNDLVISSIFVNPTQFNHPEDLKKYPRTLDKDIKMLKSSNFVDALYIPKIHDIYPEGLKSKKYHFDGLENEMEGKHRPGHFNGVSTVVEEFLRQVGPDNAYFGEKDFQQLAIIKKLVKQILLPVKIWGVPILREKNGLAMSSRNQRLTNRQRHSAKIIYETLEKAKKEFGKITADEIYEKVSAVFRQEKNFALEYFSIVEENTLKETRFAEPDPNIAYRAFIAVYAGDVRLIDNIALHSPLKKEPC